MHCKNSFRAPNCLELVSFLNHNPNANSQHLLFGEQHLRLAGNPLFKRNDGKITLCLHTSCLGLNSSKKMYRLTRSTLSKKPNGCSLKAALIDKFKVSDKEASECGRCVSCIVLLSK